MEKMPELKVTEVPTEELVEYANNAKLHPHEQVDQIASSIQEFGFNSPILAWHNENGEPEIVAGHGRLMAAKKLGMEKLPVVFLDHMTEEQRRAYILIDNKLTMNSDFDFEILNEELEGLLDFDMESFGFSLEEEAKEDIAEIKAELDFNESLDAENNYIVLKFDTDIDWIQAQSIFGIKQGKRYSTREDGFLTEGMTSIGMGRVVDGPSAINALLGRIEIGGVENG